MFPNALTHPVHGEVWNTAKGSQAHGHRGHCRCELDAQFDFEDVFEKLREVYEELAVEFEKLPVSFLEE